MDCFCDLNVFKALKVYVLQTKLLSSAYNTCLPALFLVIIRNLQRAFVY